MSPRGAKNLSRSSAETLEPVASSPELPCGDHVWCGAILAHANGSIMSVNGSYLHRLDPHDLSVVAERELPVDRSHNGLLALADGSLITKDLRLEGQGGTTVTRLEPETLEVLGEPLVLPEGSMGRVAADFDSDGEAIYVPGTEHLWRLHIDGDDVAIGDWRVAEESAVYTHGEGEVHEGAFVEDGDVFQAETEDFLRVIRAGGTTRTPVGDGLAAVRLVSAVIESSGSDGKAVSL